jgi:hypothetical protein
MIVPRACALALLVGLAVLAGVESAAAASRWRAPTAAEAREVAQTLRLELLEIERRVDERPRLGRPPRVLRRDPRFAQADIRIPGFQGSALLLRRSAGGFWAVVDAGCCEVFSCSGAPPAVYRDWLGASLPYACARPREVRAPGAVLEVRARGLARARPATVVLGGERSPLELRRLVWEAWGGPVATGTGLAATVDPQTGAALSRPVRVWAYGLAATLEDGSLRPQPAYYALAFGGLGEPRPLAARPSRRFLATGAYGDLLLVP